MSTTISLLLPTLGRATLARTLASLVNQAWLPGDEVMVLSDDNHDAVAQQFAASGLPGRCIAVMGGPHRDWGHHQRNQCMKLAQGDFLCHFDDDDAALPTMIADMRAAATQGRAVYLCRMKDYKSGRLVWRQEGVLKRRFVSTQNILHVNEPATFGTWLPIYGGDFYAIRDTAARVGVVRWINVCTCVYAPPPELTLEAVLQWYQSAT